MILFIVNIYNYFLEKVNIKAEKVQNLRIFIDLNDKVKKILETSPHFPIMRQIGFIFDEIMAKRILT